MLPNIGKVDRESFDKIIFPHLGKEDKSVMIGPKHGVDAAAIDLGDKVMVITEDPTFGMPVLMPYFGWSIVHICASDVAVLGVKPKYMTICLLLPPGTQDDTLKNIWMQVHEECKKLDIAIIGGHTGIYPGIAYPLNGGCTVFGIGKKEELTPSSNARIGDKVIVTKGPAVEAVGILAYQAEKDLEKKFGKDLVDRAKKYFFEMSVIRDALTAGKYAHAMHDATEGGLLNCVYEIAEASKNGVTIYEDKIFIPEEVEKICSFFNIDPLISIGEGTLVITAKEENADNILRELEKNKIKAYIIGEITEKEKVFIKKDGIEEKLKPVKVDPFWNAYFSTLKE
jgi:hydrogenase maturation factor